MTRILFTNADARFAVSTPEAGKPVTLTGYAMTWNAVSSDRGGYSVRLLPGSARFTARTLALVNHDPSQPLASTDTGTLRIVSDDVGARVEIDMPNTQVGRDTAELIRTGIINGMSFAMLGSPTGKKTVENGTTIVNVNQFDCDEVTVTPIPSFTSTSIAVKPPAPDVPASFADRIKQSLTLHRIKLMSLRV